MNGKEKDHSQLVRFCVSSVVHDELCKPASAGMANEARAMRRNLPLWFMKRGGDCQLID